MDAEVFAERARAELLASGECSKLLFVSPRPAARDGTKRRGPGGGDGVVAVQCLPKGKLFLGRVRALPEDTQMLALLAAADSSGQLALVRRACSTLPHRNQCCVCAPASLRSRS